jgi:hypothetical protein
MGATQYQEMFPSVLAKALAPCLGTLQTQPISVGAITPSEALTFEGQALPTIPPSALKATLTNPSGELSNATIQGYRDDTLQKMHDWYTGGEGVTISAAQKQYLDSYITSQQQVRGISQGMLSMLNGIGGKGTTTNGDQITATIALILMKVSPVIAVHFPFGGDNHSDPKFANEAGQTVSGMQAIASLLNQLQQSVNGVADLTNSVSFINLNVFGRTLDKANTAGRNHNPNHEVSMMIGSGFNGGVIGGVNAPTAALGQTGGDWACMPINSTTGVPSPSGDVVPLDTLSSWAMTAMAGVGIDAATIATQITPGKTSKVIPAALKTS